ncbi:MAG: hypothetical protein HY040_27560 [Planctomycetes bacterium]|nr:hypothetical protein [Planctomycetota bacterium]
MSAPANKSTEQELEKLHANNQTRPTGALTTNELAELCGRGPDWVRQMVKKALTAGVMEMIFISATTIAGRRTKVPAYRMVKKPTNKKGK